MIFPYNFHLSLNTFNLSFLIARVFSTDQCFRKRTYVRSARTEFQKCVEILPKEVFWHVQFSIPVVLPIPLRYRRFKTCAAVTSLDWRSFDAMRDRVTRNRSLR